MTPKERVTRSIRVGGAKSLESSGYLSRQFTAELYKSLFWKPRPLRQTGLDGDLRSK